MSAGTCPNCSKPHPYLLPLHGDRGGPPVPNQTDSKSPDGTARLTCAGCGAAGRIPTIITDRAQAPPGEPLTAHFGWHPDGRPALLCPSCKRGMSRNRGRARYNKPRPCDGRLTP